MVALQAGTLNPALLLKRESNLGTIAAGKLADLALLDGDPLTDLTQTRALRYVMRNGELFDANTLDMVWPRIQPAPVLRDTDYEPPKMAGKKNETPRTPEPNQ